MINRRRLDDLSVEELEQELLRKKRTHRKQRLARLQREGRVVEVAGLSAPDPEPMAPRPVYLNGAVTAALDSGVAGDERRTVDFRWIANKFLLLIEISAVVGLLAVALMMWTTRSELNNEIAAVQDEEAASFVLPTPEPTPVISVAILPSGHRIVDGSAVPEEAGDIPSHLLPIINSYIPPPLPTPGPEQARRIQIAKIGVDKPIVQGDDWDQLKKGVGQHPGTAIPGQQGNLVLSAHNDIFGEIFRHLDRLVAGDEFIVSTERTAYTYVIREIRIVEPTAVEVMEPTEHASATLISCYPYQINTQRIVVVADLVNESNR
jgi:sortase A